MRCDSSTGVLEPISIVPRQRRETEKGPSWAVSMPPVVAAQPTLAARGSVNVPFVAGRPARGGTFVRAR